MVLCNYSLRSITKLRIKLGYFIKVRTSHSRLILILLIYNQKIQTYSKKLLLLMIPSWYRRSCWEEINLILLFLWRFPLNYRYFFSSFFIFLFNFLSIFHVFTKFYMILIFLGCFKNQCGYLHVRDAIISLLSIFATPKPFCTRISVPLTKSNQ